MLPHELPSMKDSRSLAKKVRRRKVSRGGGKETFTRKRTIRKPPSKTHRRERKERGLIVSRAKN